MAADHVIFREQTLSLLLPAFGQVLVHVVLLGLTHEPGKVTSVSTFEFNFELTYQPSKFQSYTEL